jgi:hypothetical protein
VITRRAGQQPPSHQERQWAAQGMSPGEIAYRVSRRAQRQPARPHEPERRIELRPGSDED